MENRKIVYNYTFKTDKKQSFEIYIAYDEELSCDRLFIEHKRKEKHSVTIFSRHVSYPADAICNGGEALRICTKTALAFVSGNTSSSYHIVILEKIFDKSTDDFDIITTECDVKI